MKTVLSVFIYFVLSALCSLSLEVTAQPSVSPPTRGFLGLTIADQRRKHNAHIHVASAPFYARSTKGGSVCRLTTRICFFWAFAWIIWPARVTRRKASRHTHFAPNPNTGVAPDFLPAHFYMSVLAVGPFDCIDSYSCVPVGEQCSLFIAETQQCFDPKLPRFSNMPSRVFFVCLFLFLVASKIWEI